MPDNRAEEAWEDSPLNGAVKEPEENGSLLDEAVENGTDLVYEWNIGTGELRVLGSMDRLLGYGPGELTLNYGAWLRVLHPDDRERVEAKVRAHIEEGQPFFEEYRVICKDGSERHWSDRGRLIRDAQGKAERWVGMVNDVTARRSVEEALGRLREERDLILGAVGTPVLARDASGRMVFANDAAARFLGFASPEALLSEAPRSALKGRFALADEQGRPVEEEDFPGFLPSLSRKPETANIRFTDKSDGKVSWATVHCSRILDSRGRPHLTLVSFNDITELKRAQQELARSKDELEVILRTMDSGCTAQDPSGRLIFANRAAAANVGLGSPEEMLRDGGRTLIDRFELLDREGNPFPVERLPGRRALRGEQVVGEILGYRDKATGKVSWSLVNGTPVHDAAGKVRIAINVFHDITALRRAESEVRLSENHLSLIFNNVSDIVALVALEPDGGFRLVMANSAFLAQSREPGKVVGSRLEEFMAPEEVRGMSGLFLKAAASPVPTVVERRSVALKETQILDSRLTPIHGPDGRCTHLLLVSRDITARKRAEEAQRRHLRYMESADAVGRAAEGALDAEKVLPAALEKVLEVMECHRAMLVYPADPDAPEFRIPFSAARGGGTGELRLTHPDPVREIIRIALAQERPIAIGPGESLPEPRFWSEALGAGSLLAMPVRPRAGKPWLLCLARAPGEALWNPEDEGLFRDIASRITAALGNMRLYKDLRRSEEKYRTLFERSIDGIFRCAPDGTLLDANPALVAMLGYSSRAALVGEAQRQLLPAGGVARREPFMVEMRRLDGSKVWVEVTSQAILRSDGDVACFEGMVRNIDDRKRTEEALKESEEVLRQAQKMEAVGRLAGGVAHDFNNLLTAINGFGDLLLMQVPKDDPRRLHVEEIRKAGERAAGLTSQLLAFSRKQVLAPKRLDMGAVVSGMEPMLRRLIGENIVFETSLAPDLPHVIADPNQAEQVVMNLALNARDAMPTGGRLLISTSVRSLGGGRGRSLLEVQDGDYVLLTVSDTGTGMDDETKARLFEPFFTTKDKDKGTGLGLSMVYGAVKQGNGTIEVETLPGRGTTFRVLLPVATSAAAPAAKGRVTGKMPITGKGSETILLVEDEDAVRRLVRDVLQFNGYKVLEAPGGEKALEVAEAHGGVIHLLLTDVVMGGMSGRELAERLRGARPDCKVLYMSGYTEDAIIRHGVEAAQTAFIGKPFTPMALAAKVREVLSAATVPAA